jgi:O-antigen ligase
LIDDKAGYMRVMSTLREPNVLGAYLILPITALAVLLLKTKDYNKRLVLSGMAGLHGLALLMTQSRSAWLGTGVALTVVAWLQYPAKVRVFVKRFGLYLAALVMLLAAGLYMARDSDFVATYITHSSKNEQVADLDSNDYHIEFVKRGLNGIIDEPLGHGPGTAGLASIQNPEGSFLTENYYIQVGYEIGLLGLVIFIAIQVLVYRSLWRARNEPLAVVLLASFWAYLLTNMLLHTWSNEAVAAQWWLLAGVVIGLQKQKVEPPR